jgi:hypothetical protein
MSLKDCIDEAVKGGHITLEEGEGLKVRYDKIARKVLSRGEAKRQFEESLAVEAAERKRKALLQETARQAGEADVMGFRTPRGERDPARALYNMFQHDMKDGFFPAPDDPSSPAGRSAYYMEQGLFSKIGARLQEFVWEFRPGPISGGLRRRAPWIQERARDVVRELRGESSGNEKAKSIAQSMMAIAEELRLEFNRLGGNIGKLEGWGGPQRHNVRAMLRYGKEKWIRFVMEKDILDRDRTSHPLTKKPMDDDELREFLDHAYDRITTDGWQDRQPTGVPVGRGAMHSQHSDHRVMHFTADGWMKYADNFGNKDIYHSFVGWTEMMVRDIAHMQKFGPNPNVTINYLKQVVAKQATMVRSNRAVLAEQKEELKSLTEQLKAKDPDYEAIIDRIAEIHAELHSIRNKRAVQLGGELSKRNQRRVARLNKLLFDLEQRLIPWETGQKSKFLEDAVVQAEMTRLLNKMRDPLPWRGDFLDDPQAYADRYIREGGKIDAVWGHLRGRFRAPDEARFVGSIDVFRDDPTVVNGLRVAKALAVQMTSSAATQQNLRNWASASILGASMFSAYADAAGVQARGRRLGIPWHKSSAVRALFETINFMARADMRMEAYEAGLLGDYIRQDLYQGARFDNELDTKSVSGFLVDRVLTIGGLTPWTSSSKRWTGFMVMNNFARHKGTAWKDLPAPLREALAEHSFDAKMWEIVGKAEAHKVEKIGYPAMELLRSKEIEKIDRGVADRYQEMLLYMISRAVLETDPRYRASVFGVTSPGTLDGEAARYLMHVKSFPIMVVQKHYGQIAADLASGRSARGAAYVANLVVAGTILAMFSIAMKDMAKGKDPRRWFEEGGTPSMDFIVQAMLQGGGLGIYGDFLVSDFNRFGRSLGETLVGPVIPRVQDLHGMTAGNIGKAIQGEDTTFGKDAVAFLRDNTPSVWQFRLAYDRMILDEMQKALDPDAHGAFNRQRRNQRKNYGKDYWWAPGETEPSRSPDFSGVGLP